jgi:hypothetical protein
MSAETISQFSDALDCLMMLSVLDSSNQRRRARAKTGVIKALGTPVYP